MINLTLPVPIAPYRLDPDAAQAAARLRNLISEQVRKLRPETLLALAAQNFPGDSQAIQMLSLDFGAALENLREHGEMVRELQEAERARLAPILGQAGRRDIEITRRLAQIEEIRRLDEHRAAEREASLRRAGVQGSDLARLLADGAEEVQFKRDALFAETDALRAEQAALSRFFKTRDEQFLPEGFRVVEPLRS